VEFRRTPGSLLLLKYEDLARDARRVFEESVFPFLDLAPCAVRTRLKKQIAKRPDEILANYDEIRPCLGESWAWQAWTAPAPAPSHSRLDECPL
jgi:hypothetical protein